MSMRREGQAAGTIPFYRNVKTLGLLAQIIFALILLISIYILFNNVSTALQKANLPADFSFLDERAGVPISETPIPYQTSDTYARAFLVGIINTLRVALTGVVLTTLLGIVIGVMRLSGNWLLRQIGSWYVETIRNIPLAVQLIFWFTAILIPLPPLISNAAELPGGFYFSNSGLAMPWLYPSYRFSAWLPWLILAVVSLVILYFIRRRQIEASERPGNPWLLPWSVAIGIMASSYAILALTSSLPADIAVDFNASRGRGPVFIDENGDGELNRSTEQPMGYMPVNIEIERARLETNTQNIVESGSLSYSTFRFPKVTRAEFSNAEVSFERPEDAERFTIEFTRFPSVGFIYEDRNANDSFDRGEEFDPVSERSGARSGFGNVGLILTVENFSRRVVSDRSGTVRIPRFETDTVQQAQEENRRPFSPFSAPSAAVGSGLDVEVEPLVAGPLVLSRPTIPVSNYEGGLTFSPAFLALLIGLVVYTASYIAEIVRGGILAVSKGQAEASKALGLNAFQTFTLVVFPQAMRIIMPPMISQYLNLTKNSSLALLVTFQEFFAISSIIASQTGASIPVTVIIIGGYLVISFTFAFILNIVNSRMALVER